MSHTHNKLHWPLHKFVGSWGVPSTSTQKSVSLYHISSTNSGDSMKNFTHTNLSYFQALSWHHFFLPFYTDAFLVIGVLTVNIAYAIITAQTAESALWLTLAKHLVRVRAVNMADVNQVKVLASKCAYYILYN